MPSVKGMRAVPWNDNFTSVDPIYRQFDMDLLCPYCSYAWLWQPTKRELAESADAWQVHRDEYNHPLWAEAWVSVDCPVCPGVIQFHVGVHINGGNIVGNYDSVFVEGDFYSER